MNHKNEKNTAGLLTFVLMVIGAIHSSPSFAQRQCQLTTTVGVPTVTIDARTVRATTPRREFKQDADVDVFIVNKNPFRFTYAIGIDEAEVEETAIDRFLGIGFFEQAVAAVTDQNDPNAGTPSLRPINITSCPQSLQDKIDQMQILVNAHGNNVDDVRTSVNTLNSRLTPLKAKLADGKTNLAASDASCTTLVATATQFKTDLGGTGAAKAELAAIKTGLDDALLAAANLSQEYS